MVMWWGGNVFPAHIGCYNTNQALSEYHSIPEHQLCASPLSHKFSFTLSCSVITSSQCDYVQKFYGHDNEFSVLRWPPLSPAPLGCRRVATWNAQLKKKICSNYMMQLCRHGPESQRKVRNSPWNPSHKDKSLYWFSRWYDIYLCMENVPR